MSETPKNQERTLSPEQSQQLFGAAGALAADVLLRSGLPLDTHWVSIEFAKTSDDYEELEDMESLRIEAGGGSLEDDIAEILASGKKGYRVNFVRIIEDQRIGSGQVVHEESATAHLEPGSGRESYSGEIDPDDLLSALETYKGAAAKVELVIPPAQ